MSDSAARVLKSDAASNPEYGNGSVGDWSQARPRASKLIAAIIFWFIGEAVWIELVFLATGGQLDLQETVRLLFVGPAVLTIGFALALAAFPAFDLDGELWLFRLASYWWLVTAVAFAALMAVVMATFPQNFTPGWLSALALWFSLAVTSLRLRRAFARGKLHCAGHISVRWQFTLRELTIITLATSLGLGVAAIG